MNRIVNVFLLLIFQICGFLYAQNKHPIVLVHGFMGWGREEMGSYRYWGGKFDLEQYLIDEGYTVFTASVGPVSSNWDRAVELYYQIKGGQANPAPPVGPALGQRGINIMEFCKAFNEKTKNFMGKPVPVVITVYKDKKFDFIIKSPPASHFIKEAIKLKNGSQEPGRNIVASITKKQLEEIAKKKMDDLNANDLEEASKIIAGSAKSMGVEVKE